MVRRRSSITPGDEVPAAPGAGRGFVERLLVWRSIAALSRAREAEKIFVPLQPGDVPKTFADINDRAHDVGFKPSTPLDEGIARFVAWYRSYYRV